MKLELDVNSSPQNSLASSYSVSNGFNTDATEVKNMLRAGIAFAKEGNRADARQLLLRVTESEPANETAWLWLASISEYPEELLVFLQNVLNINPTNERAIEWAQATKTLLSKTLVQRGINASHENQKEFAKQCYLQAIVHDAENEMAWLWLASASDSTEEKISHLQKVLNINPENETALSSLKAVKNQVAQALLKKANSAAIAGERQTAREMLDEIMHQMPELEEAWILKAYLMDDFYSKIDCYEKVLMLNPENDAAQAGLASLKALIQKTSELKSEPLYQTQVLTNEVAETNENNAVDFAADDEISENAPEPVTELKEELLETAPEPTPQFDEEPVELLNEEPVAEFNQFENAEFNDAPAAEFAEEVLETAYEPVAEFSPAAEFSDEFDESFELLRPSDEKESVAEFSLENNDEDIIMTDSVAENTNSDFTESEAENYLIDDTAVPNADLGTFQPESFAHFHQMDLRQDAPNEPLFSHEVEQEVSQAQGVENPVEFSNDRFDENPVEFSNEPSNTQSDESENLPVEPQANYQEFSAPLEMPVEATENKHFDFVEESNVEYLSTDYTQLESEMEHQLEVTADNETFVELNQPETFQLLNDSENNQSDDSETHFEDAQPSNNSDYQFSEPATYNTIRESDAIKHDFYNVSDFPTVTNIDASFYHQEFEQAKQSQNAAEETVCPNLR